MQVSTDKQSRTLSIGIIGCGYWGPNYVRNFDRLPNVKIGGVCDLSEERLKHIKGLYPKVRTFHDFEELLANAEVDGVIVATPVRSHFTLAKAALLAGKHCMIEKPMASSVVECEELVRIAAAQGLTLMVGHTYLYSEPVRRIVEIVQSGDLGDLLYINSQRLNLGLFQTDINAAWDLAPHDLSIIMHLFGERPESVNCQGNAHITPGVEDVVNMSLRFGRNRFATIQNSWLEPRKVRQMTIVGTKKMIVYDDLEPREKIRVFDTRVDALPHYDTFSEFHYSYHYGDSYIPQLRQAEPLKELCEHFLECIRTGVLPRTCGRQGAELVRVLEASSKSLAASGAPAFLTDDSPAKDVDDPQLLDGAALLSAAASSAMAVESECRK